MLQTSLDLLFYVIDLWSGLPCAPEIAHRLHRELLPKLLETENYLHEDVVHKIQRLVELLTQVVEPKDANRSHTIPKVKKEIKILRLYDPELDEK